MENLLGRWEPFLHFWCKSAQMAATDTMELVRDLKVLEVENVHMLREMTSSPTDIETIMDIMFEQPFVTSESISKELGIMRALSL